MTSQGDTWQQKIQNTTTIIMDSRRLEKKEQQQMATKMLISIIGTRLQSLNSDLLDITDRINDTEIEMKNERIDESYKSYLEDELKKDIDLKKGLIETKKEILDLPTTITQISITIDGWTFAGTPHSKYHSFTKTEEKIYKQYLETMRAGGGRHIYEVYVFNNRKYINKGLRRWFLDSHQGKYKFAGRSRKLIYLL